MWQDGDCPLLLRRSLRQKIHRSFREGDNSHQLGTMRIRTPTKASHGYVSGGAQIQHSHQLSHQNGFRPRLRNTLNTIGDVPVRGLPSPARRRQRCLLGKTWKKERSPVASSPTLPSLRRSSSLRAPGGRLYPLLGNTVKKNGVVARPWQVAQLRPLAYSGLGLHDNLERPGDRCNDDG